MTVGQSDEEEFAAILLKLADFCILVEALGYKLDKLNLTLGFELKNRHKIPALENLPLAKNSKFFFEHPQIAPLQFVGHLLDINRYFPKNLKIDPTLVLPLLFIGGTKVIHL